jgi:hypothetical protein
LEIGATCRSDEFSNQVGLGFEIELVGWKSSTAEDCFEFRAFCFLESYFFSDEWLVGVLVDRNNLQWGMFVKKSS